MTKQEKDKLTEISLSDTLKVGSLLRNYLDTVEIEEKEAKKTGTRTKKQNDSFNLWLAQVAEALDKDGHTVQNVVAKIQKAEIRPTRDNLMEVMWRPYQIAATRKESSTKLTKGEVDKIYEGLNKFLGEHFHLHIPFPSRKNALSGVRLAQHNNLSNENYPEYAGEAKF